MSMGLKSMDLETLVGNGVQTTSNVGGDVGLALPLVGNDAPFRGLTAGANITLSILGDSSVEIAGSASGEVNTASNIGAGVGIFAQKVGVDLQLKSLLAGSNISITSAADIVTISSLSGLELLVDETLPVQGDTFDITGIPTRSFLIIFLFLQDIGGSLNVKMRFNSSTLGEYAYRRNQNFGSTISTTTNDVDVEIDPGTIANEEFHYMQIFNVDGIDKAIFHKMIGEDGGGAGTVPETQETYIKYVESAQIDEINLVNVGGGDFSTATRVVILGSLT